MYQTPTCFGTGVSSQEVCKNKEIQVQRANLVDSLRMTLRCRNM
jgi:hypothetical protein